jgi:hypothetical protein
LEEVKDMADRSAAAVFGFVFGLLGEGASREEMIEALWNSSKRYDFTPDQMGADEELVELGLAWYCEDCEVAGREGVLLFEGDEHCYECEYE